MSSTSTSSPLSGRRPSRCAKACRPGCNPGGFAYYEERRGAPNSERLPRYWRLDLRIQKREVFDTWFFDFYIDFFNAAFRFETIGYELDYETGELQPETVPLFIPMIGIRGEF